MARIFYGIMGDARGHMSRSLSVAQHMPGHEFVFAGGGVVLELAQKDYQVVELPMLATLHRHGKVDARATVANALHVIKDRGAIVRSLAERIRALNPDLIITDYEYFTPLAARKLKRPCVSLDHQHVLTQCHYPLPVGERLSRLITTTLIKRLYSNAGRYLISSFFAPPVKDPDFAEVLPPILRRDVRDHTPITGERAVVYVSGMPMDALGAPGETGGISLLDTLRGRKREFLIYGLGERPQEENLIFKPRSTSGFLSDLASCAYAVSNAGHNTISEALYYGKPVLCLPIPFLYEQFINAVFLERCGFGLHCSTQTAGQQLDRLEQELDTFQENIAKQTIWGNDLVAQRLESLLDG